MRWHQGERASTSIIVLLVKSFSCVALRTQESAGKDISNLNSSEPELTFRT